jgi:hypothetical protein
MDAYFDPYKEIREVLSEPGRTTGARADQERNTRSAV